MELITLTLLPVSVLMIAYALFTFYWRSEFIRRKQVGFFDDKVRTVVEGLKGGKGPGDLATAAAAGTVCTGGSQLKIVGLRGLVVSDLQTNGCTAIPPENVGTAFIQFLRTARRAVTVLARSTPCPPLQLGPIVLAMIVMLSLILITGAAIKDLIVRGG